MTHPLEHGADDPLEPDGATTGPDFAARTERLQNAMAEQGVEALLLTNLINIRWVCGFTGTAGRVYLSLDAPAALITDHRYTERAADEAPAAEIITDRGADWLLERHDLDIPLAVEADDLTWAGVTRLRDVAEGLELTATTGLVASLRQIKDASEVAHLRRACAMTAAAFEDALTWLEPGLTEIAVARRLLDAMTGLGADGSAFAPIVAAGPNGSRPHHDPSDRTIKAGDLITMDFGALVAGYHADMTRTVAVGRPAEELRRIHAVVRAAQDASVSAAREGVVTAAVDEVGRSVITKAGYGEHFVHGTGHGVGLMIHEDPFLGSETTDTLRRGMTVTVEPGVYLPGTGGVRIEDVVLVAGSGPERLTTATRELITL